MNRPRRRPDFRLEEVDNEILLYHPGQTKVLYCNQTAALVWELCRGEQTVEEMIAVLKKGYPDAAGGIADDVKAALQTFREQGAIEFV
jgi:hypothetical protein